MVTKMPRGDDGGDERQVEQLHPGGRCYEKVAGTSAAPRVLRLLVSRGLGVEDVETAAARGPQPEGDADGLPLS